MTISRRTFITGGLGLMSVYLSAPQMLLLGAQAAEFSPRIAGKSKVLVVVQMSGGNDGLNTVVPYGLGNYYQVRPNIGIKAEDVLRLDDQIGLNPNMDGMHKLFKNGNLAVVQAVGYPNPNRSHFRSIEIWQTGQPERIGSTGWLGRYLDLASDGKSDNIFPAVNVEPTLPKTLASAKVMVPSVSNVYDFKFRTDPAYQQDRNVQVRAFNDIYDSFNLKRSNVDLLRRVGVDANKASEYLNKVVRSYKADVKYPDGSFGKGLKFIAQMISGAVNSSIYTVNLDGFDTHTNQLRPQNNLLKQLSEGVSAFMADMEQHGLQDDVVVLAFSEFGRRVAENGSRGTDHGTAEPVFLIGKNVKGGIYGDHPSLSSLDDGDLRYKIDFRSIYSTLLDRWLKADSKQILAAQFDTIPFI